MTLAAETGPIPSQFVKDSRTDPTAGSHTSQSTSTVGTITMSETTTRSTGDRWSIPLYLDTVSPARQEAKMLCFCFSMLLTSPSMSLGFLMKDWMAGIITVEAKSGRVSRSMNWAIDLADFTNSADFFCRAEVAQELLGPGLVLGPLGHHVAVDGRLDRVGTDRAVDLREVEEVEVVLLRALLELLGDKGTQEVGARLLLLEGLRRLLPGAAERVGLVQVEHPGPGVEDRLDLVAVPGLLARHQADVEVEAVDPHVELVEGAHRGPAVLVAERDRDQTVLPHLGAEGLELVQGLGRLVAELGEHALAVEDGPRVVGRRHEVLLAVVSGGGLLQGVRHAAEVLPDVRDVAGEVLAGEEAHPVPREPGPHVVRGALEVVVDVLLERVVVDRVDLDRQSGVGLLEGVHHGLDRGLGHRVGLVGPQGHGAGGLTGGRGAGVAAAGG